MSGIQNLPEHILLHIFELSGSLNNLTLVCQQWKNLIEKYSTFSHLSFFNSQRTDDEHLTLSNSTRKYESLTFRVFLDDINQLKYLGNYLESNNQTIRSANIVLRNVSAESPLKLSTEYFYSLLYNFRNFQDIQLKICWVELIDHDWNRFINFGYLKILNIIYSQYNNWNQFESVLSVIRTPVLEKVSVIFRYKCQLPECPELFKFVNVNARSLKDIDIMGDSFSFFRYTPNYLCMLFCQDYRESITSFFKIKTCYHDLQEIEMVFDGILEFGDVSSYLKILHDDAQCTFPGVKQLTLRYFSATVENIEKLSTAFPNLEILYYWACRNVSDDLKLLLWRKLKHLRKFDKI